jgi:aminoglycoside 6'-N-acetyltransferase I
MTTGAKMTIREVALHDRAHWCRLRDALWPGSLSDHELETRKYFEGEPGSLKVFVADLDSHVCGFLELDYRPYAPGCRSSPVPFIEGWYVEPEVRGRGIGRALVVAAEKHVRAEGFGEIASDVEIANLASIAAHVALGYSEVERTVCFRRSLRDP